MLNAPRPNVLPLSKEDLALWRGNIEKSRAARKVVATWWDANLKQYAPAVSDDPEHYGGTLNTNRDFTLVERKKADLFYQRPDVMLLPSPLFEGQEALLDTHTKIVNEKLGLDGVNAKRLVHEVLFDVLCPAGRGWTIMGYESATVDTPTEMPSEPMPQPGSILGLAPGTPQTQTVMAPVPLYQDCFWIHISPRQALAPHDARSTNTDAWAWIGYDFEIPVRTAKRKKWVPETYQGGPSDQDLYFDHGTSNATAGDAVAKGVLLFYKSALYRDDRVHPLHQTLLVLMDGIDDPAEHKDCPYQTIDQMGALTPDSLLGYAIHPLTIRTLTDATFIPSDCTISRPIVNELNKTHSQMIEYREAAILRWMYSTDRLPPDALSKIVRSPIGGFIGVPDEAFVGEGAIKELPHGSYPRENFEINEHLDNDLARTHALDANQGGALANTRRTATETQIQQSNVNARLGLERGIVLDWYCQGVTKYSTLLQRYLTVKQAAAIVGQDQAAQWDMWRKQIPASLAFTAMPDSALQTDLAWERKRAMEEYTFLANDPFVNRLELMKQLAPKLHYGPKIINPQPPQKGPEPAKPTFSFKGDDLNPLAPQFPIVMEILRQAGVTISPEAVGEAQAGAGNQVLMGQLAPAGDTGKGQPSANGDHGGKVAQMESLSKHAVDQTGGMQGTGQPAPMGAGGMR